MGKKSGGARLHKPPFRIQVTFWLVIAGFGLDTTKWRMIIYLSLQLFLKNWTNEQQIRFVINFVVIKPPRWVVSFSATPLVQRFFKIIRRNLLNRNDKMTKPVLRKSSSLARGGESLEDVLFASARVKISRWTIFIFKQHTLCNLEQWPDCRDKSWH